MSTEPQWAAVLTPVCDGLARLLAPHAEVLLHDVATDTIVGIWNNFSGRKVGDPALLAELPGTVSQPGVLGPYEKVGADGRRITSISSVVPDADGSPVAVVCINLDRSPMDSIIDTLQAMVTPAVEARPAALFERDWREQIALTVDQWCKDNMVERSRLTRPQRLEIVRLLEQADLFATRHAAQHASIALGVSRATVYSLITEVRKAPPDELHVS
jgi:D-arginine utilization repressor